MVRYNTEIFRNSKVETNRISDEDASIRQRHRIIEVTSYKEINDLRGRA